MKEMDELLQTHPDWVNAKRFGNSLARIVEKHPEGAPNKLIASVLGMTEDEVDRKYKEIVLKLRAMMAPEMVDE